MRMITEAMAASVHGAGAAAASKPLQDAEDIFWTIPIVAAFLSFALAQSLKVFSTWFCTSWAEAAREIELPLYMEKRSDWRRIFGPGGMPSSHAATVMALSVAIGLRDGYGSSMFAIAFVFACVVMYDASGVRLEAGRQADVLNQIICEMPPENRLSALRPLRGMLGHTNCQVAAGALLGAVIACILHFASVPGH